MSNDKAAGVSGLNEKEKALIKLLRNIKYGDVRIIVKDGIPIRAEQVTKSIISVSYTHLHRTADTYTVCDTLSFAVGAHGYIFSHCLSSLLNFYHLLCVI